MSEEKENVTNQPSDPSAVTEEILRKVFDNLAQQREKLRALLEQSIKGELPSRKDLVQMLVHTANTIWLLEELMRSLFQDMIILAGQHGGVVGDLLRLSQAVAATQRLLTDKEIISEEEMKETVKDILEEEVEAAKAELEKLGNKKETTTSSS